MTSGKRNILDRIREGIVLYDGAMGTMLISENLNINAVPPEYWNLEKPSVIRKIYQLYYDAGSDVVQTNTFGANKIRLSEKEFQPRVYEMNYSAAKSLREVCPPRKFVAGSIGPTGRFFGRVKSFSKKEIQAAFEEQIQALVDGGVDVLSIETMCSLQEALCALRVAKKLSDQPVSVSMTFKRQARGFFTDMGETVKHCVDVLSDFGADIVGANCMSSGDTVEVTWEMRKSTFLPILVQPNAGPPIKEGSKFVYQQTPLEFVRDCLRMADLGADLIGGCCGTNPEFIRTLYAELEKKNKLSKEENYGKSNSRFEGKEG